MDELFCWCHRELEDDFDCEDNFDCEDYLDCDECPYYNDIEEDD